MQIFAHTPRVVVNELLHFNQAYRNHLYNTLSLYQHRECIREAIRDTELRYRTWDALRDAQQTVYSVMVRRQALATLRSMIGQEAYEMGAMPCHVDLSRFEVIR